MRQFLAIELPAALRAELGRLQAALEPELRGWRWVRPANLHLTLRFLGEVPEERDRLCRPRCRRTTGERRFAKRPRRDYGNNRELAAIWVWR